MPTPSSHHSEPPGAGKRGEPARARRPAPAATETPGAPERASLWPDDEPAPLPDNAPQSVVRDSLYDVIPLGALELDLIATPAFVRLQGVKQLGFVYRVWPGATHSRFEHSLGVYYLMLRALRALLARPGGLAGVAPVDLRTILAAALLHDIGHYPFSHAIEELGHPIVPHERVGRAIIAEGAVAETLARHRLDPARVAGLVDPAKGQPLPWPDRLLVRLLSGALDVDKLDYLPRDARACNVPYGGVDVTRLLGALTVLSTPDGLALGVNDKGISPLNSLLHARQEMFDNVYWHHTNRAMMAMLLRAVQEALAAGAIQPEHLRGYDDAALLDALARPEMPGATRALVADLRLRRPYKVALEISSHAGRLFSRLDALFWDQARRRRVELALAAAVARATGAAVPDYGLLIDIPKPEKWAMDVLVGFAAPPVGMGSLLTWAEATGQRPSDLGIYEQHQRRIRVVSQEALRDALGADGPATILAALEGALDA
ncbi:MAG TPA: HD domain-containing protein [Ktedonobacterales bacterium]|nr:HD domain-containing protein [Ktedonobacterales bacterium]